MTTNPYPMGEGGQKSRHEGPTDQAWIDQKRRNRMARIDAMPPELRALVNDYGYPVVDAFVTLGVKEARHIRHLVETVLDNFSPTRGCYAKQGVTTPLNQVERQ